VLALQGRVGWKLTFGWKHARKQFFSITQPPEAAFPLSHVHPADQAVTVRKLMAILLLFIR